MPNFGQYQLLDRIAVGGMAEVFRGRAVGEEGFEKLVAIKRVLPTYVADARFVSMLVTEARIHASLSHRNIVQIHDLGLSEEGEYFIVLEYVDGPDLATLLARIAGSPAEDGRTARLPDAVALYVAIELGEGMHFAHDLAGPEGQVLGLVHRDISPSNVLLSYAGEVKLSDFGLAKRRTDQSVVGSLKGKLAYMSPEQARRSPLDRRSDIFSLGAVLFEMLTGHRLREIIDDVSGWQQVASGLVPPARRLRPDLSPALEGLLAGALAPDPRDRFADARAFVAATRAALADLARSPAGEAGELGALLRQVCPLGATRKPNPPSKVIRLMSEFLASGGKEGMADLVRGVRNGAAGGRPPASTTAVTTIGPAPTPGASRDAAPLNPEIERLTEAETERAASRAPNGHGGRSASSRAVANGDGAAAGASAPRRSPPVPIPAARPSGSTPARLTPRSAASVPQPAPASRNPGSWTSLPALPALPSTPPRGTASPPTPARGTALPSTPPRGTASPGTPARGTASPSTPRGTASPPTPVRGTASPSTPPRGTASPGTPARGTASPSTPRGIASPGTPARGTASPSTPPRGTASPGTPARGTPSPPTPVRGTAFPPTPARGTVAPSTPARGTASPDPGMRGTVPATPARGTAARGAADIESARRARRRSGIGQLLLLFALGATVAGLVVHFAFMPLPVLAVWGQPARFEIRSDPVGAEIYLDGQRLYALTPTYIEVRRDRRPHSLELRKEGFQLGRASYRYDRTAKLEVVMTLAASARPGLEPLPPSHATRPR